MHHLTKAPDSLLYSEGVLLWRCLSYRLGPRDVWTHVEAKLPLITSKTAKQWMQSSKATSRRSMTLELHAFPPTRQPGSRTVGRLVLTHDSRVVRYLPPLRTAC